MLSLIGCICLWVVRPGFNTIDFISYSTLIQLLLIKLRKDGKNWGESKLGLRIKNDGTLLEFFNIITPHKKY